MNQKPTHRVRPVHNGYAISFHEAPGEPAYMIFEVTYIEAISWGLMATVTVRTNIAHALRLDGDVLFMDRLNLMQSRQLGDMAKRIDALIPAPRSGGRMDWQHHLEHVAVLINVEQRRPAPTIDLSEHPAPQRQRFVVPGLLAKDKANILYGPGGVGKSVLALRIAASVSTGADLFGFDVLHEGRVLYLDWEDDAGTMTERLGAVAAGMDLERLPDIAYKGLRGRGPYERHHADVRLVVEDEGILLVVFDSTAMAMHGAADGDMAEGAIRFFDLVSQLGVTALLIDHIASDDVKKGSGTPKPYGSVFKVNAARNMWEAQAWKPGAFTGVTLRHRKTNVGPRMDDVELAAEWDEGGVRYRRLWDDEGYEDERVVAFRRP